MYTHLTLSECLNKATQRLKIAGSSTPFLDAQLLLMTAIQGSRIDLITKAHDKIHPQSALKFEDFLKRREEHEPISYILGFKEFMGLEFRVNPNVLIPRPDTEILFEKVYNYLQKEEPHKKVLDIGTGSGCLAISLAHFLKDVKVTAWDKSKAALLCARENADRILSKSQKVSFSCVDALVEKSWENLQKFDLIMSNPPYIAMKEKSLLCKGVLNFEPHEALFANKNGLEFYLVIAKFAHKILKPEGCIFVETSSPLFEDIKELFERHMWKVQSIFKDLAGHKRVIQLCKKGND